MPQEVTALSPQEEQAFQHWAQANRLTDVDHPDAHYDYRGFWKQTQGAPHLPGSQMHFPDTFKQHGHPTFSVESKYSAGPNDGGHWNGDQYVPQASGWTKVEEPNGWTRVPEASLSTATTADLLKEAAQPGGVKPSMTEGELVNDPSFVDRLNQQMRGAAHPQSVGDMLPLLIPDTAAAVASGARMLRANLTGALDGATVLNAPRKIIGRLVDRFKDPLTAGERSFNDAPLYKQMESLPTQADGPLAGPVRSAEPPYTAPPPSDPNLAQLEKDVAAGRQPASVLEGYKRAQARGVLRVRTEPQIQPMASHAQTPAPMPSHGPDPMQAAIDAKRYEIGSEAMGREFQTGPGKTGSQAMQDVRDLSTAKPSAAAGDASPVLPTKPFNRVFDTLKQMAPDARPDYVGAAKDPKTYAQLETIRRSLERLGLSIGSVAGLREALRMRMGQDQQP